MEKSEKVKEIFEWYHQYNNNDIKIKAEEKEFYININDRALPHLLGLQYILNSSEKIRGRKLYEHIRNQNMSDQEIYDLVSLNNEDKLNDVVNRINTFKEFMKNLDKGYILEQTNPHTQIKSQYLVVQSKDNLFLHLGIKEEIDGDRIVDFKVDDKTKEILETYFARGDIKYFENSKIFEKIEAIERYEEKEKEYIPFSFDEEKNKILLKDYYKNKEQFKNEKDETKSEEIKKFMIPKKKKVKEENQR